MHTLSSAELRAASERENKVRNDNYYFFSARSRSCVCPEQFKDLSTQLVEVKFVTHTAPVELLNPVPIWRMKYEFRSFIIFFLLFVVSAQLGGRKKMEN